MILSNDILCDIKSKKEFNITYSKYYYRLSKEYLNSDFPLRARNIHYKSERMLDCCNLWLWEVYHQNKVMDLQKVNRCMDKFCPNCKKLNLASAIHNLRPTFDLLLQEGYQPFLLTLTVPNVLGAELRNTVDKLNKAFYKLYTLLSKDGKKGFKNRYVTFDGALKVFEVTTNNKKKTYHPHLHIMVFCKNFDKKVFDKCFKGPFSTKRKSFSYYSKMDYQIMKLWKLCYDGLPGSEKNYNSLPNDWTSLYLCDIKEMDIKGIYEVLKYTFKDTDIKNYTNFKDIFLALEGKRLRQGYGLLYNVKVEDDSMGELQELALKIKENPEQLLTREINDLITIYQDYLKISRFKATDELKNI